MILNQLPAVVDTSLPVSTRELKNGLYHQILSVYMASYKMTSNAITVFFFGHFVFSIKAKKKSVLITKI